MAKGNMLLGMSRGSVGDVVMSRVDGVQVSRIRNRNPKVSHVDSLIYQRAIMATVSRAYSAGKEIFDHSFQGRAVGMQSQAEFISRNAKALRKAIVSDINSQNTLDPARVIAPGSFSPVPNNYIVSNGTLKQRFFTILPVDDENQIGRVMVPKANEGETIAQYANRFGLVEGELYTFVIFWTNPRVIETQDDPESLDSAVCKGGFSYVRLKVDFQGNAGEVAADSFLSSIFVVDRRTDNTNILLEEIIIDSEEATGADVENFLFVSGNNDEIASLAVIRSIEDSKLRSSATMQCVYRQQVVGVTWDWIISVWKSGAVKLGNSDLILEGGGNYAPSAPSVPSIDINVKPTISATITNYNVSEDGYVSFISSMDDHFCLTVDGENSKFLAVRDGVLQFVDTNGSTPDFDEVANAFSVDVSKIPYNNPELIDWLISKSGLTFNPVGLTLYGTQGNSLGEVNAGLHCAYNNFQSNIALGTEQYNHVGIYLEDIVGFNEGYLMCDFDNTGSVNGTLDAHAEAIPFSGVRSTTGSRAKNAITTWIFHFAGLPNKCLNFE